MKKVIFVGGTSYSGSTFFDMTLANDPKGFSCGEVRNFLYPTEPFHVNPRCGCAEENCTVWPQIKRKGADYLYESIFDMFPDVEFIVDSSKDPLWIHSQSNRLAKKGIETKHILIWKTPLELAHSYHRRNRLEQWEKTWVTYHRFYPSLIKAWRGVKYSRYTTDKMFLKTICRYLKIPYFTGKERYWEKTHHILGGNHAAKVHLYRSGSNSFDDSRSKIITNTDKDVKNIYRSVYYKEVKDESLQAMVEHRIRQSPYIANLLDMLEAHDVTNETLPWQKWPDIQVSPLYVQAKKIKRAMLFFLGKYKYERNDKAANAA